MFFNIERIYWKKSGFLYWKKISLLFSILFRTYSLFCGTFYAQSWHSSVEFHKTACFTLCGKCFSATQTCTILCNHLVLDMESESSVCHLWEASRRWFIFDKCSIHRGFAVFDCAPLVVFFALFELRIGETFSHIGVVEHISRTRGARATNFNGCGNKILNLMRASRFF